MVKWRQLPSLGLIMSYQQLQALLDPAQFLQMKIVRQHLLQDPTTLDKINSVEEKESGKQEDV